MKNVIFGTALIGAIALSGTVMADELMVKEIEVQTDMDAIENAKAAAVWQNLDEDLASAILTRVSDRIDDQGAIVAIDIDEISLANNFELATGLEDATLRGWVKVDRVFMERNQEVEMPEELYELTVSVEQARVHYPDGTDVSELKVDSEVFYQAMLAAFAENVVEKLQ